MDLYKMESSAPETPAVDRRVVFLLYGGLLAFAAIHWGISAGTGAPFVYHPDEPDVVGRAVTMVVTGDLNPHWFHYPTLLIYIYAALFKFMGLFLEIPMELGVFVKVRQGADPQMFVLYHAARVVMICFSLGTLYLALRLCSRLTSPLIATLAGITFAGSGLVRDSATSATVDMPMAFFALASLLLMVSFVDSARDGQPKESRLWLAAVMGGMAAGAKYNGGAVLVAVPLAMWLARMPLGWSLRRLPLLALASIAVFAMTTPWVLLDAKTFFSSRGLLFHFTHYTSGHPGADEGVALFRALSDLLRRHSFLAPLALLSPLALLREGRRSPVCLVAFAAAIFLGMVGVANIYFARNMMPLLPLLDCLIAAGALGVVGIIPLSARIKIKFMQPRVLAMSLILVVACWSSLASAGAALQRTKETDTRTRAYEWMSENLPPGARILQEAYCPQLYFADRFAVTYLWSVSQIELEKAAESFEYVVVSETQWRRFSDWGNKTYGPLFERPPVRSWSAIEGESHGPEIRLYSLGAGSGPPR